VGKGVDVAKVFGRLFRAIWADANYEVWASLRPGDGDGDGGRIAVQVIGRAGGNRTLLSEALDEDCWDDGARRAALAVAGALYPNVSRRYRGPWSHWKGNVPHTLIDHHQRAIRHEEANRLEQAMGAYHDALLEDPLNPHIRLRIAKLQERLALHLDAWATYRAIVGEPDRHAWKGVDREVRMIALYRLAILLGNGRVAAQWMKRSSRSHEASQRDHERAELRNDLLLLLGQDRLQTESPLWFDRRPLESRGAPVLLAAWMRAARPQAAPQTLAGFFPTPTEGESQTQRGRRRREVGAILEILSLRQLEDLRIWLRPAPPLRRSWWRDSAARRSWWRRRPPLRRALARRELSPRALRVSELLIRARILASLEAARLQAGDVEKGIEEVRDAHRRLLRTWPFPRPPWRDAPGLALARALRPGIRWANRRDDDWQLHYNAACALATVLREGSVLHGAEQRGQGDQGDPEAVARVLPAGTGREDIVTAALCELEEFAHRAGSDIVVANADWIAIDDPDLDGLAKARGLAGALADLPGVPQLAPAARGLAGARTLVRGQRPGRRDRLRPRPAAGDRRGGEGAGRALRGARRDRRRPLRAETRGGLGAGLGDDPDAPAARGAGGGCARPRRGQRVGRRQRRGAARGSRLVTACRSA